MSDLVGGDGELRMTIEIIRKDTGKKEAFDLVGFIDPQEVEKLKGNKNGSNP